MTGYGAGAGLLPQPRDRVTRRSCPTVSPTPPVHLARQVAQGANHGAHRPTGLVESALKGAVQHRWCARKHITAAPKVDPGRVMRPGLSRRGVQVTPRGSPVPAKRPYCRLYGLNAAASRFKPS